MNWYFHRFIQNVICTPINMIEAMMFIGIGITVDKLLPLKLFLLCSPFLF